MKTVGFLSMRFEENEKRDFRPVFFKRLASLENTFILENSYGSKLGYAESDYLIPNKHIRFCDRDTVLNADSVVSIRTPDFEQLGKIKSGALLFSMLHYLTRGRRNEFLTNKRVRMLSMDSVVDDFGKRMIEDFPGTVENAFNAGYAVLLGYSNPSLLRVLILGSGEIGKISANIAIKRAPVPVIATVIGRSVTQDDGIMNEMLSKTDVLVDASKRHLPHKSIISNEQLGTLPEDALIIDLSADDYDTNVSPIQVKGIEGIPTGNLDKYIFFPDDPAYDSIPVQLRTINRRTLLSCNAWPGVDPIRCLNRYELQMDPFIRLIAGDSCEFSLNSENPYERALARGSYAHFLQQQVIITP